MPLTSSPVLARVLLERLDQAFPTLPRTVDTSLRTVATFPAWHPEVGDLLVEVFGDELIVHVGHFAHVHFDDKHADATEEANAARLVDAAIAFMREVFLDRIEFYGGRLGGRWRKRGGPKRGALSRLFFGTATYVWSGPLGPAG